MSANPLIRILVGDCRTRMASLEPQSVQCAITSPPYFGLRDYRHGGQIGLEPTPDEFIAAMVEVMREVWRVLRDDGTLWLNIGDSYAGSGKGAWANKEGGQKEVYIPDPDSPQAKMAKTWPGTKAKDLIGIPWMLAFALRADGWYLRQDIIWEKPNPMPESVQDRCTKSHEYLFLLTKRPTYYFDAGAIAEEATCERQRGSGPMVNPGTGRNDAATGTKGDYRKSGNLKRKTPAERGAPDGGGQQAGSIPWEGTTRNKRSVWEIATRSFDLEMCTACKRIYQQSSYRALKRRKEGEQTIVTCRCGEEGSWLSHFATFPPELVEPCIKAGSREGDTILDPFGGAGTTALVADRLRRNAVICELNPDYAELARWRIAHESGLFGDVRLET